MSRRAPTPDGPRRSNGTGSTGIFPPARPAAPASKSARSPRGRQPEPVRGRRPPPRAPRPPRRFIDYPRWGRTGWRRWVPSWRIVSAAFLTGIILLIVGFIAAYATTTIPKPDQQALAQTTIIYYAGGKDEIGRLSTQNRQNIELAQVPLQVRQAVLAAEDHTFYSNSGIDPRSIVRAAWSNVRGNSLQGGSTITQQYVKNVYNERDRSFKRKYKEIFLALKINRQIDKDQILARYLNTIYLGRGAYGIQAASQAYFGVNVEKLTVSQGAFLAGVINAPSLADPRDGAAAKARAERRWAVVLDAMVQEKWLDAGTRQTLKFPATKPQPRATSQKGQVGYLMEMAQDEAAAKLGVPKDALSTGGYKIVTTFDKSLIADGVQAVTDKLPSKRPKGLRVGMASIDPATGAVKAIYGGPGVTQQLNQATKDKTQAGSTFKAFTLAAALEDGVSLKNVYNGRSPIRFKGYSQAFTNFSNEQLGYINLLTATEESVNTVYLQLNHQIGPEKTAAAALAAGIPKDGANVQTNLTNVLGTADPHTIDMASAYATFAAQGIRHTPYVIASVSEVGTGKSLWVTHPGKGTRVFDADVMADLTYALRQPIEGPHGTGTYARQLGRPAAGKTGTSTGPVSAWFVGFTPQLATAVSMHEVGSDGKKVVNIPPFGGFNTITGGSFPVRIWTQYMKAALAGKPVVDFPDPSYGGDVTSTAPTRAAIPTRTARPTTTVGPTNTPTPTGQPTATASVPVTTPTRSRTPRPTITVNSTTAANPP